MQQIYNYLKQNSSVAKRNMIEAPETLLFNLCRLMKFMTECRPVHF